MTLCESSKCTGRFVPDWPPGCTAKRYKTWECRAGSKDRLPTPAATDPAAGRARPGATSLPAPDKTARKHPKPYQLPTPPWHPVTSQTTDNVSTAALAWLQLCASRTPARPAWHNEYCCNLLLNCSNYL